MDVRILTLSKQHYLDSYEGSRFAPDYSCWGYYDGLSMTHVKNAEGENNPYTRLFQKKSRAQISTIWYETAKINESSLQGTYSQQEIGLFRSIEEDKTEDDGLADLFHSDTDTKAMPFFAVAFLQLKDAKMYREVRSKIECNQYWAWVDKAKNDTISESVYRAICYTTFDNDDLVVLLHSNDLRKLEKELHEIEGKFEVRYLHSVVGVREERLKSMKERLTNKGGKLDDAEFGQRRKGKEVQFVEIEVEGKKVKVEIKLDTKIDRIRIKMVTSGEHKVLEEQYEIFEKNRDIYRYKCPKRVYAEVHGHEDAVIELRNTDVYTLLAMIVPGGFSTHQNEGYTKKNDKHCVYNIETVFTLGFKGLAEIPKHPTDEKDIPSPSVDACRQDYCLKLIEKYQQKMKEMGELNKTGEKDHIDESLYAYYQLFLHTLNNLAQYEQFKLADDIFYLIYPSLRMFDEQMDVALEEAAKERDGGGTSYLGSLNNTIKEAFNDYLTAVTSVIYHTIHTDQMFLMIPGYSGAPYSLPIKLNMLYLWIIEDLFGIFGEKGKYSCILEPTMDDRPRTSPIVFGLDGGKQKQLIHIKLSPRSLYIPRHLMIILSHEIGHYIGGKMRCREKRFENLKKVLVHYIVERTFPKNRDIRGIISWDIRTLKEAYEQYIREKIEEYSSVAENKDLYGEAVKKNLTNASTELLYSLKYSGRHGELVARLFEKTTERGYPNLYSKYDILNSILDSVESGVAMLLSNFDKIEELIEDEVKLYQEIFSDLIPYQILVNPKEENSGAQDINDITESIRVSEGVYDISAGIMQKRKWVLEDLNREYHGEKGLYEGEEAEWAFQQKLRVEYASECFKKIEAWINDDGHKERKEKVENLSDLFSMFKGGIYGQNKGKKDASGDDIYKKILEVIEELKKKYWAEIAQNSAS